MRSFVLSILFVVSLFVATSTAQDLFSPKDQGETPNRSYDVLHYKIEITLHGMTKSLEGKVTTTLVPLFPALKTIVFDAGEMKINRVTGPRGKELHYTATAESLFISLDRAYSYRDTISLAIEYACTPTKGLTFNNTDGKIPGKRPQIWSQGEETTNHYWFPCYDYPNDKATSEVIGTVDARYEFLSNGKLISVKENKKEKTKTYHWKETKPHSSYLIMIAAGEYTILHDHLGKLPLEYYVYPDDTTDAWDTFRYTPAMIKFFNETIGFNYPWEKYAQIILQDHFGGMENTSATTLADTWAVPDARARIDNPSISLLAHELSHQWWGDLVTCKDFRHMWLNESFASYYDPLFLRTITGEEEFEYTMFQNQGAGIRVDTTRGRKPIVSVESYGENVYPRGSAVLHMLRHLLGDDLYHRAIQHYITKFQYQPVETSDLKNAIEETTGQNLQWFFDEWVYKAGHPIFDVTYTWNEAGKNIALHVSQVQREDSLTGIFRMPVDCEITTSAGSRTYRISILSKDSTYLLPAAEKPLLVIFDKGDWLIKDLRFTKSFEEWRYQALFAPGLVDRLLAVQAVARMSDAGEAASVLGDRIRRDPFWAVRREAVNRAGQLAAASSTLRREFEPAFLQALNDQRAEVRAAAAIALRSYRDRSATQALEAKLTDSSYTVLGNAIYGIAKTDSTHALRLVERFLKYPSHQNVIVSYALSALAALDTTRAVDAAITLVKNMKFSSTRRTSLAIMRRYGNGRSDVLKTVVETLNDPVDDVRGLAAQVLGVIGDSSVIPQLESVANDKDNPAKDEAKTSIEKITRREKEKK